MGIFLRAIYSCHVGKNVCPIVPKFRNYGISTDATGLQQVSPEESFGQVFGCSCVSQGTPMAQVFNRRETSGDGQQVEIICLSSLVFSLFTYSHIHVLRITFQVLSDDGLSRSFVPNLRDLWFSTGSVS